jgi:MarR family transcriptional regulator, organic hydroperoxide resistance regulator
MSMNSELSEVRNRDRGLSVSLNEAKCDDGFLELAPTVGYLVRDVHRAFSRALQDRISAHGVSMGQWFFLRALWDQDGLTQRELSQKVGMMEPTTVTALNSMERRGLVERVRNVNDRRKVNIYLTSKGHALRDVLLPEAEAVNVEAVRGVSKADVETAMAVLRAMNVTLASAAPGFIDSESDDNPHH